MLNIFNFTKYGSLKVIEENKQIEWPLKYLSQREDLPESLAKSMIPISDYNRMKYGSYNDIANGPGYREPKLIMNNDKLTEEQKISFLFSINNGASHTEKVSRYGKLNWCYLFPNFRWKMKYISDNQEMNAKFLRDTLNDDAPFKPTTVDDQVMYYNMPKSKTYLDEQNSIDWKRITFNTPMNDILSNLDIPWSKEGLSMDQDITLDTLNKLSSELCHIDNHDTEHHVVSDRGDTIDVPNNFKFKSIIENFGKSMLQAQYKKCIKNKSQFKEMRPEVDEFRSSYLLRNFTKDEILRFASQGHPIEKDGIDSNRKLSIEDRLELEQKLDIKLCWFDVGMKATYEQLKDRMHFIPDDSLSYNENLTLSEYFELTGHNKDQLDINIITNLSGNSDISREFDKSFPWNYNYVSTNKNMTSDLMKDLGFK